MNIVIQTKDFAQNFFAVLGAIIWDLATLPIRLVTFLPRMAYNAITAPEEHPLIPYLKGKGLDAIYVGGEAPTEAYTTLNGEGATRSWATRFLEKDGRVDVLLYTKSRNDQNDQVEERSCKHYSLYLTDREIAFPTYKKHSSHFVQSLNGQPIP